MSDEQSTAAARVRALTDVSHAHGRSCTVAPMVSLRNFLFLLATVLLFKFAIFGPISRQIGADEPAHATFDVRWSGYSAEEASRKRKLRSDTMGATVQLRP